MAKIPTVLPKTAYKVKRSKSGLGLFATESIKKGTWIIEYTGERRPNAEVEDDTTKYLFEVNNKITIDGKDHKNTARYINHACYPNCEVEIISARVFVKAIKNIKEGEEFFYDYGKEYFEEFIAPHGCRCEDCFKKLEVKKVVAKKK